MGYAFGVGSGVSELVMAALAGAAGPMSPAQLEDSARARVFVAAAVAPASIAETSATVAQRREALCTAEAGNVMSALVSAPRAPAGPMPGRSAPGSERSAGFVDLSPGASIRDGSVRRAADGLFYVNAQVNGVPIRFLIDTGASVVVLTPADAERSGVMPSPDAFHHQAETAGGRTAMARVTLASLSAGATERQDIDAAVGSTGLGVSLLGQSWLSKLQSITITGDRMVLQ